MVKRSQKVAAPEESTSGYFRKIFAEQPRLLKGRSNAKVLERWLADHPTYESVPANIKANLANLKSHLRSKRRTRRALKAADGTGPAPRKPRGLEALEEHIDQSLMFARGLGREELANVINLLRKARNEVVWRGGE